MLRAPLVLAIGLLANPVWAEDGVNEFIIGDDVFIAGRSVTHDAAGTDDLFIAGDTVLSRSDIMGSAHLAGREVTVEGAVSGDVYVAAEEILISGEVANDATATGRSVSIATVGGDVRVAGVDVQLSGDIGGYLMAAGENIQFNASVGGDVSLASDNVRWGDNASIAGRLIVYEEEPGELVVPDRVVPADRLERREIEEWEGPEAPSLRRAAANFMFGVVVVAGLASLIAALVPERLAEMRQLVLSRPFHTLWLGFMVQSAVVGAGVIFAITIVGLILTPAMIFLALAGGFAGYVVAAYAFGVGLMSAFNRPEPDSINDRALAAGVGALVAGIIGLIPFLGWLFVLSFVLAGVGAITLRVIRPAFFVEVTI
ncbi:MAG: hypothetical protein AAFR68_17395 [Pseudomonadota bacterium]